MIVKILKNKILKELTKNDTLSNIRDWAVGKIDLLHESDRHKNAKALEAEFQEWIHIPDEVKEIDVIYIDLSCL